MTVAAASAPIEVRHVSGLGPVLALAADWDDLAVRATGASPFTGRAWVEPWLLPPRARGAPCAFAARAGGRLVALLVVTVVTRAGVRIAEPPDAGHPAYHGLLADPAHPGAPEAIAGLCASARAFDVLSIGDVLEGDDATDALCRALGARGFHLAAVPRNVCLSIALERPFDAFLRARKSGKSVKNLRQEERLLAAEGVVALERLSGPEVTPGAVRRAARIQEASWMVRRGAAVLSTAFHERLAVAAARGDAGRLWFLTVGGADAAFGYALAAHGRVHFVWTAFALRYERFSAGKVLVHRIVRDVCDAGFRSFDFGHGDAAYKRFWATRSAGVRRFAAGRGVAGALSVAALAIAWRLAAVPHVRTAWCGVRSLARRLRFVPPRPGGDLLPSRGSPRGSEPRESPVPARSSRERTSARPDDPPPRRPRRQQPVR